MPVPKEIDLSDREAQANNFQGTVDSTEVMKRNFDQCRKLLPGITLKLMISKSIIQVKLKIIRKNI